MDSFIHGVKTIVANLVLGATVQEKCYQPLLKILMTKK